MTHENHDTLYSMLAARGVTRRDFLKWCGSVAALLGMSEAMVPQIVAAVESGARLKPALWVNGGACTGCTESTAQSDNPDVATIVLDIISANYFETIMMAQGEDAEKAKADTIAEGGYLVIFEGSVMLGQDGNTLRVAGKPQIEELPEVFGGADAIVAVGSCAVDGGWVAAEPNPAEATGVKQFLADNNIETPLVNLPTCPVNPEWVVATLINVLVLERVPEMDDYNRPTQIFSQTIHDNCPRRGHFENGEFVFEFGSEEEAKGYCMYALGCKGPQTFTNCPIVRWNQRVSWCVEAGAPCIGCGTANPNSATSSGNWVDENAPFLRRPTVPLGVGDYTAEPTAVGLAAAGIVGAGLLAHGIAWSATGRLGEGAPYETEKEHDAKKGGGE